MSQTVIVAGAGMAGLVAAARLRELGVPVAVLDKGDRLGGSMLLSSGVIWRHRSFDDFRAECPHGDPALQRLIFEHLDESLDWLERLGAQAIERKTGNPHTSGRRFDPQALTRTLAGRANELRLREPLTSLPQAPVVLATGGFAVTLARELGLPLRASPWSEGDGIRLAREEGGALFDGMDEFYGRAMPDVVLGEADFVRLAQVYGRHALVLDERGEQFFPGPVSWSENDLVQAVARQPGGRAWYILDSNALRQQVRGRTVEEMVEAAREAGGPVVDPAQLPFAVPSTAVVAVRVVASVTHTIGGLRVDSQGHVLDERGDPLSGVYAAGVDAGGWSTGGYASGLAAALVLGLTAAEAVAAG